MTDYLSHKAIVFGLSVTGIGIGRSLGIKGVKVDGYDYLTKSREGFKSRYIKANLCPNPVDRGDDFIDFIIARYKEEKNKPVIFIAADEYVKAISCNREKLDKYFVVQLPDKEIIDDILEKSAQHHRISSVGIDVPRIYTPESISSVIEIGKSASYPLIVKGNISYEWRVKYGGSFKGFEITNSEDLTRVARQMFVDKISFLIQEVVPGKENRIYQVYSYYNSRTKSAVYFQVRKHRQYPINYGNGSFVESADDEHTLQLSKKIISALNYEGLSAIEFKYDADSNKAMFIEINPRLAAQNYLATYCGVNMPYLQYSELTTQIKVSGQNAYKRNIFWIDAVDDFRALEMSGNKFLKNVFIWIKSVSRCKVFALFFIKDPLPFISYAKYGVKVLLFPLFFFKIKREQHA